jgi:hypothetical protein
MLTYQQVKNKPKTFKCISGLTVQEFENILCVKLSQRTPCPKAI